MREYPTNNLVWLLCSAGLLLGVLFLPFYVSYGPLAGLWMEVFQADSVESFLVGALFVGYMTALCWFYCLIPAIALGWVLQAFITIAATVAFSRKHPGQSDKKIDLTPKT